MVLMDKFIFCCSVRLGTIVTGCFSIIQFVTALCLTLIQGDTALNQLINEEHNREIDEDVEPDSNKFIEMLLEFNAQNTEIIYKLSLTYLTIYFITCLLVLIGSYKLFKWLLLPFIITDFLKIIILFVLHVTGMLILKEEINLGALIGLTLAGGFGLLLLGYNWVCVIALFQIITIVKTDKYRSFYGNDPLAPIENVIQRNDDIIKSNGMDQLVGMHKVIDRRERFDISRQINHVENVKVYPEPNFSDDYPVKYKRQLNTIPLEPYHKLIQTKSIDVVPVNPYGNLTAKQLVNLNMLARDLNAHNIRKFNIYIE